MRQLTKHFFGTLLAFALIAGVGSSQVKATDSATSIPWHTLGDKAPELNVDFIKGEPIALAKDKGTHVFVIEFWATWCGPCRYSAPKLSELQKKFDDQGLVVIGISDEDAETVKPFLEKSGGEMEYRVALDRAGTTHGRYFAGFGRPDNIPTAYVIDGDGRVAWIGNPLNPFMATLVERLLDRLPRNAKAAGTVTPNDAPAAVERQKH